MKLRSKTLRWVLIMQGDEDELYGIANRYQVRNRSHQAYAALTRQMSGTCDGMLQYYRAEIIFPPELVEASELTGNTG